VSRQLSAFRIIADPLPQDLTDRTALGRRSKFGGRPTWEQRDETPTCPDCGKSMVFVAQLDSIGFDAGNVVGVEDYIFGDVGLIYVFFCFEDGKTSSVFQCT
jgi:uncharacterized protein YwqG